MAEKKVPTLHLEVSNIQLGATLAVQEGINVPPQSFCVVIRKILNPDQGMIRYMCLAIKSADINYIGKTVFLAAPILDTIDKKSERRPEVLKLYKPNSNSLLSFEEKEFAPYCIDADRVESRFAAIIARTNMLVQARVTASEKDTSGFDPLNGARKTVLNNILKIVKMVGNVGDNSIIFGLDAARDILDAMCDNNDVFTTYLDHLLYLEAQMSRQVKIHQNEIDKQVYTVALRQVDTLRRCKFIKISESNRAKVSIQALMGGL